jgi:PD-(D/E)XK nuclease superfamily
MGGRTIIDILRKGNQELFHSSIIAWLLDPEGEHGFGPGFLHGFAEAVERSGCPKMRSALQTSSTTTITTETTARRSQYDTQGQRVSNSLKSQDFREEAGVQHTADHLAPDAVLDGVTLQKTHREATEPA